MAQVIEINDGDTVNVIEVQLPYYGGASAKLEFGARATQTLAKGDVVYVSGATGTHIQVTKAQANSEATSAGTIGLATSAASTNADLQVITFGLQSGLDTSAYTAGDVLYLSAATAGGYTTTLPAAPNHGVRLGWVVRSHPTLGQIFVEIQNYQELDELSDVNVTSKSDGQVLTWNAATSTWVAATPNPGDITAVNVTSPITGGGTSGAVTVGIDQAALSLTASQISDGSTTWARLATANSFSVGGHGITSQSAASIPLLLTQAAAYNDFTMVRMHNEGTNGFNSSVVFDFGAGNGTTAQSSVRASRITSTQGQLELRTTTASTLATFLSHTNGVTTITGQTFVSNAAPATIGTIIRGAASQTANLQEWQNSAGTIQSWVDSSGTNFFLSSIRPRSTPTTGSFVAMNSNQTQVIQQTAGAVAFLVRGAASQTGNLQEWQNSGSSVMAWVDKDGFFYSPNIRTPNSLVRIAEFDNGGVFTAQRTTAAVSNPGTNLARLYFRDGTNAGTLKLVVRAGNAGAETTILDNIPQ